MMSTGSAEEPENASRETLRGIEQQQQQQHLYRALFDEVQNAVVLADDSGRYVDANPAACELFGLSCEKLLGKSVVDFAPPGTAALVKEAWKAFLQSGEQSGEFVLHRPDGTQRLLEYRAKAQIQPGIHLSILKDVTERRQAEERAAALLSDLQEERDTLDTINRIGRLLSAELDLDRLVQAATDAATEITGAQFGAFFYNVIDAEGASYLLYTISGAPREAFSQFPHPRATPLFGPTFRAEGIIRSGDITRDPRYGTMEPYHGMPPGHLPVRSYLAVPVTSRSGEVLGGLFFGHAEPDVFTDRAERNLIALTAQIAVAMDNARLYGQAQQEIEERRRAEEELSRKARHAALRADVSAALAQGGTLQQMLQRCAEPIVEHLDAAFARIWTLEAAENVLALQASAGMYTHLNGPHSRVPVGEKKIGLIAQEKKPHLTNDVLSDERIGEKEWARREGMVAFAGYPLLLEDRVVGVVALFARHPLLSDTLDELAAIADVLAQGVERKTFEQRLAESEMRQRTLLKDVLASVTEGKLRLCDSESDLPERLPALSDPVPLSDKTLRVLRRQARQAARAAGLDQERESDLLTAASEAAMNAVVHAGGGTATVGADLKTGLVQVWVEDRGSGIDMSHLPRATLDRGYTTAGTLGHGFKMVLSTVDVVWLLTGPSGTTVVLTQGREIRQPGWLLGKL